MVEGLLAPAHSGRGREGVQHGGLALDAEHDFSQCRGLAHEADDVAMGGVDHRVMVDVSDLISHHQTPIKISCAPGYYGTYSSLKRFRVKKKKKNEKKNEKKLEGFRYVLNSGNTVTVFSGCTVAVPVHNFCFHVTKSHI